MPDCYKFYSYFYKCWKSYIFAYAVAFYLNTKASTPSIRAEDERGHLFDMRSDLMGWSECVCLPMILSQWSLYTTVSRRFKWWASALRQRSAPIGRRFLSSVYHQGVVRAKPDTFIAKRLCAETSVWDICALYNIRCVWIIILWVLCKMHLRDFRWNLF